MMTGDYTDGNPITEARNALDKHMKQVSASMNELTDGSSTTIGGADVESKTSRD